MNGVARTVCGLFGIVALSGVLPAAEPHRTPVAVAVIPGESLALTANSTAGSVSLVNFETGTILQELPVGAGPAEIVAIDSTTAAVSLQQDDAVAFITRHGEQLKLSKVVPVGDEPRGLAVERTAAGGRLFVALSTTDRIVSLNLKDHSVIGSWPTGGIPRNLAMTPDQKYVVSMCNVPAEVIVHDIQTGAQVSRRKIFDKGFNLGTPVITADSSTLILPHAVNRGFPVTPRNIEIGWVIDNRLSKMPLPDGDAGDQKQLGLDLHRAAVGDAHMAVLSPDGRYLVVSCGGSHELLVLQLEKISWPGGDPGDFLPKALESDPTAFWRIRIGGRPLGLSFLNAQQVLVANALNDSLQVVNIFEPKNALAQTIALGSPAELSLARRGEHLFYDADRSLSSWYSCHTCHPNGHTAGQSFDTKNDGGFGAAKLIPTLHGVASTGPWTWHGWQKDLGDAMRRSLLDSMSTEHEVSQMDTAALVAYLETLTPAVSPHQAVENVERGQHLFAGKAECARCHQGETFTSSDVFNVGLTSPRDRNPEFNPPSLRGLYARRKFLHDGRATTLEAVLTEHHRPQDTGGVELSPDELKDLIAYLLSI